MRRGLVLGDTGETLFPDRSRPHHGEEEPPSLEFNFTQEFQALSQPRFEPDPSGPHQAVVRLPPAGLYDPQDRHLFEEREGRRVQQRRELEAQAATERYAQSAREAVRRLADLQLVAAGPRPHARPTLPKGRPAPIFPKAGETFPHLSPKGGGGLRAATPRSLQLKYIP